MFILWDFFLSCTFLPAAIIINETYFSNRNIKRVTPSFIERRMTNLVEIAEPSDPNQPFKINQNLMNMRLIEKFFVTKYHIFMIKYSGLIFGIMTKCIKLNF